MRILRSLFVPLLSTHRSAVWPAGAEALFVMGAEALFTSGAEALAEAKVGMTIVARIVNCTHG
jgi:hypothetical protein